MAFFLGVSACLAADKPVSDDTIYDKVRIALASDIDVKGGNLKVDVKDGAVTLNRCLTQDLNMPMRSIGGEAATFKPCVPVSDNEDHAAAALRGAATRSLCASRNAPIAAVTIAGCSNVEP